MSATIRRGGKGVRRTAAARGRRRGARPAGPGVFDRLIGALPVSERGLRKVFLFALLGAIVAGAAIAALSAGVPELARQRIARIATDAGLIVRHIEVRGVSRMDEQAIYEKAIPARTVPMPLLDIAALRAQLVTLPWVSDARVSRQFPDTLVIDVVERVPHAVLRQGERFVLIDPAGHRLEPIPAGRAQNMLVLSGEGADTQALRLSGLLEAAPALKDRVRGAEWIGRRRWNLTFATGQVVALPEGEDAAVEALAAFAELDRASGLLGGRVTVFDMRAEDRIYMRVPGHAAEQAKREAERKRLAAANGD